jgi:hypothetical protein
LLECHKHLCADYLTKYYILNILKNKNFLEPKLNYINFIKKPVCLEEKNFIIYPTIKYENRKYNLLKIYPKEILINDTIKIIHQNNENTKNKFLCVFGVLENENGLIIEKEMNEWLLPEYNVYTVYQKYPGKLFEYPALRFAQWLLKKKRKKHKFLLYIHTKGAFYPTKRQKGIRECWKNEYTGKRKFKYIIPLKKKIADVTCILTGKKGGTWFNSFFISKKGFKILGKIKPMKNRYSFERLFEKHSEAKVMGILKSNVSTSKAWKIVKYYKPENYIYKKINKK